jgi:hypothetical protein
MLWLLLSRGTLRGGGSVFGRGGGRALFSTDKLVCVFPSDFVNTFEGVATEQVGLTTLIVCEEAEIIWFKSAAVQLPLFLAMF